jgi:hypothetical protein
MTNEIVKIEHKSRKEYINQTYEKILKILETIDPKRKEVVVKMLETLSLRFFTAPASSRTDYHSCFPGGLARHSLMVLKNVIKAIDAFKIKDYEKDAVIIVSLFHDLGKVGTELEDYYIPQKDSYWMRRGYHYQINDKLSRIPVNILTLNMLQRFDIKLKFQEFETIYTLSVKNYSYKEEHSLAALIHWADMWSIIEEKKEQIQFLEDKEAEKEASKTFDEDEVKVRQENDTSIEEGKINYDELTNMMKDSVDDQIKNS